MRLVLSLLLTFFPLLFAASLGLKDVDDIPVTCVTPNNDLGRCIEIRKCLIFMTAIRSHKKETYNFIRASSCGTSSEERNPKVCCGTHDNYLNQTNAIQPLNLPANDPFPFVCGEGAIDRVVGGSVAGIDTFPWMARLRHLRNDGLFSYGCTGFLISEKFVLTAAHCINSTALAPLGPIYQVQLGEYNTETDPDCEGIILECADPPQYIRTAPAIVHPDYSNDQQYHNDIAVIPLQEAAVLSVYVSPICLSRTPSQNDDFWVSGWGRTELSNSSPVKLKVMVPRADWTQCSNLYKTRGVRILDSQICAGGEAGKDSCTGDSGGPLMVEKEDGWYAEGIVSTGKACGAKDWPGIYTNIPKYMPWIELVVRQYLERHIKKGVEETEQRREAKPRFASQTEDLFVWNKQERGR